MECPVCNGTGKLTDEPERPTVKYEMPEDRSGDRKALQEVFELVKAGNRVELQRGGVTTAIMSF